MIAVGDLRVVGIDPGPTPGVVVLDLCDRADSEGRWLDYAHVAQVSVDLADSLLTSLLLAHHAPVGSALVAVEAFVHSRKGRSGASRVTRDLVPVLRATTSSYGAAFVERQASQVKAWATDERLDRAAFRVSDRWVNLLDLTKGMRHARDAARHALFAACRDGQLPDPLSKAWSR